MRRTVALGVVVLVCAVSSACGRAAPQVASAATAGQAADSFTGTVAETMNAGGYTYVRLQSAGKADVWAAAPEFAAKVGDRLSVPLEMPMVNFESKSLERRFALVYFVSTVSRDGEVVGGTASESAAPSMMAGHGGPGGAPTTVEPVAPPEGGVSIADLWKQRKTLAGREVMVRGQVVKANNQILGKNWIHLQDGSGVAADRTNDITITTDDYVTVGEDVTIKGVLAIGRDIGGGYAYDAIVENARVVK